MKNIFIVFIYFIIDQLTKFYIVITIPFESSYKVTNFLNFVHIKNKGFILGFFSNLDESFLLILHILLFFIAIIIIFKLIYVELRFRTVSILLFAGAIGNSFDRIFKGGVIDFLDFHYFGYHWPAFNIADLMISLGVIIYILIFILEGRSNVHRPS